MGEHSTIEWTDATWNPVRGCSRTSPGCGGANHEGGCYAEKIAARFSDPGQAYHGFAERTPYGGRWTGKLALVEEQLTLPLRWKKPRRIFVNSMSDLFHENLSDAEIDRVFAVMALAPQHTFQVLTKRAARMYAYLSDERTAYRIDLAAAALAQEDDDYDPTPPFRHIWLGVSVEDQQRANERIPLLLGTPAHVHFLSCEPLLGPIDLKAVYLPCCCTDRAERCDPISCRGTPVVPAIDWVIVGEESGRRARICDLNWIRDIRDQCAATEIPFFLKQFAINGRKIALPMLDGRQHADMPA